MATDRIYLRISSSLVLFLLTVAVNAQVFHIINDTDGSVNVRATPGTEGKIICQLNNGEVVRESWNEDTLHRNWVYIEFYVQKKEARQVKQKPESKEEYPASRVMTDHLLFTGYIYKDKLINIEDQEPFQMDRSGEEFLLYNDSIRIKMNDASFEKQKHKIEIKDNDLVEKIDGHYFVGTDGEIPRYEFKTFSVEIDRQKIIIPRTAYYDLYHPNLNGFTNGYVHNGTLYIIMRNSDGAGVYEVVFIIKNKKYIGRYVFDGEC